MTSLTDTSTRRRRGRTTGGLLAAVLLAALAPATLTAAPAGAAAAPVSLSATAVTTAPDFATDTYADPWDYNDVADLSADSLVVGHGDSGNHYANGAYGVDMAKSGWLDLVETIDGAIPYGRDGKVAPIDTSRYSRLSIRMYSSVASTAQVYWFSCGETAARCFGVTQFATRAGWQNYDIPMVKTVASTTQAWSGPMTGLRLYPAATTSAHIVLDDVRLYRPVAADAVRVTRGAGSGSADVVLSPGTDHANPAAVLQNGRTLAATAGGATTLDTSMLSSGPWSVGFRDASGAITWASTPITVAAPPSPVVLDPDAVGGTDVTSAIRGGDRYDFSQASDVQSTDNVAGFSVSGGQVHGTNGAPQPNANDVWLPVPKGFSGSQFHRLTFTASYTGPYGLQGTAGGGMVMRLIWQTAGNPAAYQDLNDIVVHPGVNTITVDLATNPSYAITDEHAAARIGWAGQTITALRFDPNEDPGNRSWTIDDIRIAQDDAGAGSYAVHFQDAAWAPGTTADVYADTNASGYDGTPIATGVPVASGVNAVSFNLGSRPAGKYWIYTVMHRAGSTTQAYSTGPVQMTAGAKAPVPAPRGSLDAVSQVPGGVQVGGWAADPALAKTASSNVHFYVDGHLLTGVTANGARPDVDRVTGLGPNHGFNAVLTGIAAGRHQVCAYAIRTGGPNPSIGCRTVAVAVDPVGSLDLAGPAGGAVRVGGWSLDPDTAAPTAVHVYLDGHLATGVGADGNRPDIARTHPGYGAAHGYNALVPASAGTHQVCTYAINAAGKGNNTELGCKAVTVTG